MGIRLASRNSEDWVATARETEAPRAAARVDGHSADAQVVCGGIQTLGAAAKHKQATEKQRQVCDQRASPQLLRIWNLAPLQDLVTPNRKSPQQESPPEEPREAWRQFTRFDAIAP